MQGIARTRRRLHTEIGEILRAGESVILHGVAGIGKTALATDAARSHARSTGARLVRASPSVRGLATPSSQDAAAESATTRDLLLVDDAHALDADGIATLADLIRAGRTLVVATARRVRGPLARLVQDGDLRSVEVGELDPDAADTVLQEVLGSASAEAEALLHIRDQAGGHPQLLRAYAHALRYAGALVAGRGALVWTGARPHAGALSDVAGGMLEGLGARGRDAAEIVALCGPLHDTLAADLAGEDGVTELAQTGLLASTGAGARRQISFRHPALAEAVRDGVPIERRLAWLDRLAAEAGPGARGFDAGSLDALSVIALAERCDRTLPLDVLRDAWAATRGRADTALLLIATGAVLRHPDAPPADRLRASAERVRALRMRGAAADAAQEAARGRRILEAHPADIGWDGRLAFASARASVAQYADDDLDAALACIDEVAVVAERDAVGDVEMQRRERLIGIERVTRLAFAGRASQALAEAGALGGRELSAESLQAATPLIMLHAMRGDAKESRRVAVRAFPLALKVAKEQPWMPSEIVIAGTWADLATGHVDRASLVQSTLSALMRRPSADLPPHDVTLHESGNAQMEIVRGEWAAAAERLAAALARYDVRDPAGMRGGLVASYALALSASGRREEAEHAAEQAQAAMTGASRLVAPHGRALLAYASLWRGEDVRDAAARLVESARADGLRLVELHGLHALALYEGSATPAGAVARAAALAAESDAPIAAPLAGHIADLRAGLPALEGAHARLLARHGLRVPDGPMPSALTSREREVAASAALGYSSKAIAQQLHLSKRTVDAHLNRVYAKLHISARDDLPRALRQVALELRD